MMDCLQQGRIKFNIKPNAVLFWFTLNSSVHAKHAPLNCRGGCYFCGDKSNQKRSRQEGFFAAQAFALQIRQNRGCNLFAGLPCRFETLHAKICYALPLHKATIVLPAFTQS